MLKVAQQRFEFVGRGRLILVRETRSSVVKHRAQLGQSLHRLVRLMRQRQLVLGAEQPVDETLDLLRAQQGKVV